MSSPLLLSAAGLHAAKLWNADRQAAQLGSPHPRAFPGATDAPLVAMLIALAGAFALLHPFIWRWDEAGFVLTPDPKGRFSVTVVLAQSSWLYAARFGPWNPRRSLLPCFVAYGGKNLGVLASKHAQGSVSGWF